MLVGQRVLARRIEHDQRAVGNDGGELLVLHGIHAVAAAADAHCAELARRVRLDDAVDVLALFTVGLNRLSLFFGH